MTILDNYAKSDLGDLLEKLNEKIDDISAIDAKLKLLGGNEIEKQNLIDLYRYQIEEIKNANLEDGELEELEADETELRASEGSAATGAFASSSLARKSSWASIS